MKFLFLNELKRVLYGFIFGILIVGGIVLFYGGLIVAMKSVIIFVGWMLGFVLFYALVDYLAIKYLMVKANKAERSLGRSREFTFEAIRFLWIEKGCPFARISQHSENLMNYAELVLWGEDLFMFKKIMKEEKRISFN